MQEQEDRQIQELKNRQMQEQCQQLKDDAKRKQQEDTKRQRHDAKRQQQEDAKRLQLLPKSSRALKVIPRAGTRSNSNKGY
jgi:hypothetical protein